MRRVLVLGVLLATLCGGSVCSVDAQRPDTPAAQDEFVPISELPEAEKLPAAPLLIGAYAFIWVAVFGYLWSIWRRLGTVDREMASLRRRLAGEDRPRV